MEKYIWKSSSWCNFNYYFRDTIIWKAIECREVRETKVKNCKLPKILWWTLATVKVNSLVTLIEIVQSGWPVVGEATDFFSKAISVWQTNGIHSSPFGHKFSNLFWRILKVLSTFIFRPNLKFRYLADLDLWLIYGWISADLWNGRLHYQLFRPVLQV